MEDLQDKAGITNLLLILPEIPMADNCTMAQMLQTPTEGYEDAIVIPEINANFELKHGLINLVQNKQFFGHDKEDPHAHIRLIQIKHSMMRFPDIPSTSIKLMLFPFSLEGSAWIWLEKEPPRSILTWDDLVSKVINQLFPPSKTTNLHSLNSAAGGNFLDKMPRECLRSIESKSKTPQTEAKKTVQEPISPEPKSYQPKLPYPERMKNKPFLRTAKALIDLYEEKLTLRVGSDELVFYAEKSEESKNKQFAHAISVIDFSKDEPFSGSTTNHSDALPPSSSPVKTSEILEEFADELTLLKKGVHEENFQVYSNPLFEFDDNFNSSNENPLFNEIDEDVENENSNVSDSDEPVLLNSPLTDKVESFAPEDDIDEIDAFLAMEVSSNFEEGYFDSEGDVIFLENLLSDDTTHNLAPEVISDHEPEQNESSITFSPRSDPLHHEFAGELITLPSRIVREHEDYLSRMTLLCEISTSRSQENVHANPSSIIESLPVSLIPVEDSDPVQEEIDIFLVCFNIENDTAMNDEDFNQGEIVLSINVEDVNSFTFVIWIFLPFFTYLEDSPVILSLRNEDLVFDPGISTFHFSFKPVPFALPKDE
ncbi:hypothetical protein Tco_0965068 [Tanacetum coccineum]